MSQVKRIIAKMLYKIGKLDWKYLAPPGDLGVLFSVVMAVFTTSSSAWEPDK